jgi:hypothetical protein
VILGARAVPVETSWYVEKRIFYQRFYGVVTLDDFPASMAQTEAHIAAGTPPVHAIADLRDIEKYPPLFRLSRIARRTQFDGMGWTIILVTNPILRFIGSMLTQFMVSNYRTVATLEDAVEFLRTYDSTLTLR